MSEAEAHRALYAKIPGMRCIDGCTACCGPVPFSKWEWEHLADKRTAKRGDVDCPYSKSGKCDIYDDRPFMCRLFGTAGGTLECPHGARPIALFPADVAGQIADEYRAMEFDPKSPVPTHRWMHK